MKFFKNKIGASLLIGLALGIVAMTGVAAFTGLPQLGVGSVYINSASTTATNAHFGNTTNGIWPIYIGGGDLVTNWVAIPVPSGAREASIQVSGSAQASIGAVTAQSAILTCYKSISGGTPTNAVGTGLLVDTLGSITLAATSSTTGPWTVVSNFNNSLNVPLGCVSTIYLGKLDLSAMTNTAIFTNYSVWVKFN